MQLLSKRDPFKVSKLRNRSLLSFNGGALYSVEQGAQRSISSARQVWEANTAGDSDSETA